MKGYSYSRGWDGKHPFLTEKTPINIDLYQYAGVGKRHGLVETVHRVVVGNPNSDYEYVMTRMHDRVPSPKGVMRWRYQVLGTGQDTPVYSYIEIVADVNGSRPRLP